MNLQHDTSEQVLATFNKQGFEQVRFGIARDLKPCSLALVVCLVVALSGCAIPTGPALIQGRGTIEEADLSFLRTGSTTREEVLLRFGEPDIILNDQRILAYHWSESKGVVLLTDRGTAIGEVDYLFMLEFDAQGYLKRFERSGDLLQLRTSYSRLVKWIESGGTKVKINATGKGKGFWYKTGTEIEQLKQDYADCRDDETWCMQQKGYTWVSY